MVSTPKDNVTTIHALLGLPNYATLEQVFAAFDEAKKNPNKNPWHIKEVERLLLDVNPDGRANIHDLLSSQSAAKITTRVSGDNFYGKKKDPPDDDKIDPRRRARKAKADGKVRDMKLTEEEKELLRQVKNENAAASTFVVPPSSIDKVAKKKSSSSTVSRRPTFISNPHRMNYRDTPTNETSQTSLNSHDQIIPTKGSIVGSSTIVVGEQDVSAAIVPDLVNRGDAAPSRCFMAAFRAPSAAVKRGVEQLRSAVAATFGRSKVADAFSTADRRLSLASDRSRATVRQGDPSSFEDPCIVTTDVSTAYYNVKFNPTDYIQYKLPTTDLTNADLSSCENTYKTEQNNTYINDATSQDSNKGPPSDTARLTCTANEVLDPISASGDVHDMPTFERIESSQKHATMAASVASSHDAKSLVHPAYPPRCLEDVELDSLPTSVQQASAPATTCTSRSAMDQPPPLHVDLKPRDLYLRRIQRHSLPIGAIPPAMPIGLFHSRPSPAVPPLDRPQFNKTAQFLVQQPSIYRPLHGSPSEHDVHFIGHALNDVNDRHGPIPNVSLDHRQPLSTPRLA